VRGRLFGASMLAIFVAQAGARAQTAPTGATAAHGNAGPEEIVVTATKRSERLQRVPIAVQVLDAKTLAQQNVNGFNDYLKLIPSLSTQTFGPNATSIYLRGVSPGDNANHSGPLPTVGSYLDEYPTTTIGGTLDVHAYDIARIEVLPGPQGTLYGASSEAGTVRIITNKPDPTKFSAGYSTELNGVVNGGIGYVEEGFVNVPVTDQVAVRIVAFDERDAGYISNVYGTRTFPTSGDTINNSQYLQKNANVSDTVGGRVSALININNDWSISPMIMGQDLRANGSFAYEPDVGNLQVQQFHPDTDRDRWAQAGLTVNGKLANFTLTYAGSVFVRDVHQRLDYTDYSIGYDQAYGSGFFWQDAAGNPLANPQQYQDDKDHFNKVSNEVRLASPVDRRFRFIVGGFQEYQTHLIQQDYRINGFSPALSVPGWNDTIWLTDQKRTDRDYAGFIEASYDILPNFTLTAGVRGYAYDNSLFGFYGYSAGYAELTGYSSGEGANNANCIPGESYKNAPCVNLAKAVKADGETHKINLSYKIDPLRMVYFTYATGFRPGGVNRYGALPPYQADFLTSYELGLKSQWFDRRLTFDAALYDEDWQNFQFAFLGVSSLTQIQNAAGANIRGMETAASFRATDQLTLSGGLTLQDPHDVGTLCNVNQDTGVRPTNCPITSAVIENGDQLPFTSSIKGSFTARDEFPVTNAISGHVQATVSFQSRAEAGLRVIDRQGYPAGAIQIPGLGSMPAFSTLDLSAGLAYRDATLELFAKNVTNSRGQLDRYLPCSTCTNIYVIPITPTTIGIRLSQKF
jgi:outer membrane receptor protein involved in Fe transport